MKVYIDVYKEVKEALPWATEDMIRKFAYKSWKAQNQKQPEINVEAPKVEYKKKEKLRPKLYPMSSKACHELANSHTTRFKLCEGRKIRHKFICNRCGYGRSFGYITPYGLLCPQCAAKKAGGHGAPHYITTPMRD